ncbi:MAG: hypothetical protein B7Z02_18020, partial [Rhodobacterales bacterium 32-67-9]
MAQAGSEGGPAKATRASRVAEDLRRSILRGVPAPGEKVNLDRMRDQNERYMRLYGPLTGAGRDIADEHAAIAAAA